MDNITIWAQYAAQNHMSYGKCKAAVENGILPPPNGLHGLNQNKVQYYTGTLTSSGKERKAPTPQKGPGSCIICGKTFVRFFRNQVTCGDSYCKAENNRRHAYARAHRKEPPDYGRGICIICGNWFEKGRENQVTCGGRCAEKSKGYCGEKRQQMIETAKKKEMSSSERMMCGG